MAFQMNHHESEKLKALYHLSACLSFVSDSVESLRAAKEWLQRLIKFDALLFFIDDQERECLVAPAAYNESLPGGQNELTIPYDQAIIKEIKIANQYAARIVPENPILSAMSSELFVPIISVERTLGCLYVARSLDIPFARDEIQLAELAARLLSTPLERSLWMQRQRKLQMLAQQWREKYLALLDSLPYPASVVDLTDNKFDDLNNAFLKLSGYDRPALLAKHFSNVCIDFMRHDNTDIARNAKKRPLMLIRADGREVKVNAYWNEVALNESAKVLLIIEPDAEFSSERAHGPIGGPCDEIKSLQSFVEMISHDLKLPIQSLKSYLSLLNEECGKSITGESRQYLGRAQANLDHMENMLTELFDFYRADHTERAFEFVSVLDVVESALAGLAAILQKHPVVVNYDSEMPTIYCNRAGMIQVFTNLLSNAIKFVSKSGQPVIEIGYRRSDCSYEFFVKDNGVGLASNARENIFAPFYTSGNYHDMGGSGLGLSIVKDLIEMHGGNVWAEANPSGGTIFKFTIPIRKA
jgi:signal transduction histidine kinase